MKRIGKIFLGVLCAGRIGGGGLLDQRPPLLPHRSWNGRAGGLFEELAEPGDRRGPMAISPGCMSRSPWESGPMSPWRWGRSWATLCWSGASPGRYRIAHTSSGNAPFRCGVIEENGGKQLLFQGRNTFGEIDRVQITLDRGYEYELKLPPERGLFSPHRGWTAVSPSGLASVEQVTLYDGEGAGTSPNHFSRAWEAFSKRPHKTEGPSAGHSENRRGQDDAAY